MFFFGLFKLRKQFKKVKSLKYYIPKDIIKSYSVITNGKRFYDQPVDTDIKQYEEIKRLTTRQGEDYTTRCLLDYGYIKNNYKLIVVDLVRKKNYILTLKQFSK